MGHSHPASIKSDYCEQPTPIKEPGLKCLRRERFIDGVRRWFTWRMQSLARRKIAQGAISHAQTRLKLFKGNRLLQTDEVNDVARGRCRVERDGQRSAVCTGGFNGR